MAHNPYGLLGGPGGAVAASGGSGVVGGNQHLQVDALKISTSSNEKPRTAANQGNQSSGAISGGGGVQQASQ